MKKGNQKKKQKHKQKGSEAWQSSILRTLSSTRGTRMSTKQVISKAGLKKKDDIKKATRFIEQLMREERALKRDDGGQTVGGDRVEGTVDHVSSRFAYIVVGKDQPDIYVRASNMNTALHGDRVKVGLLPGHHGESPEGRVVEILKRKRSQFVGKIQISDRYAFVVPDFRKLHQDFFVDLSNTNKATNNDKVIVEVIDWGRTGKNPEAKVVEVLGRAGENEAEIHSIMAEFGLPLRFPQKVLAESQQISADITSNETARRRDFRKATTFTIDPDDAKDFDDALSFRKLENGHLEIGIHIADVSHYVVPETGLDKEALSRGTSVYLVDRTVPMLPERLSNELCSLRPNEDRLTFSAVFEMDAQAKVHKEWFGRTIIHSDRRFAYEEAQEIIDAGKGDFAGELRQLNDLALKLRKQRFDHGAINFETTEVKFRLDEKGRPLGIVPKIRKDAHKLIEEFMLLANRQVACFVFDQNKGRGRNTFAYRIHDFPDPDRIREFATFAKQFGHRLDPDTRELAASLNRLMTEIEGKPEQNVLEQLAIRSMAKAKYSTELKGHFGLAFDHYTHFTSPIRRYPDLMVHRLLQHYLDGGNSVNKTTLEEACIQSSELEKRAADAERASIKYKQVEFMTYAEDKLYEGLISGVTEWGIYVEITETRCEGMIRISDIGDDYYEFDQKRYRIVGKRRGRVFTLGDKVRVRVKKTDIDRRLIDLKFAEA